MEMINKKGEEGPFYIFYDPAQNLYVGDELALPDLGSPFDLPTNCRNTRHIAKTCSQIRGVEIAVRDDAPEGVESTVKLLTKPEARVQAIKKYVDEWVGKGKLKPSQIAILSPYEQSKSSLAGVTSVGRTKLCTNPNEWRANKGVLVTTIRRFKGLEADAVIVTDIPDVDSSTYFTASDFYVGCSRAKHLLVLLFAEANKQFSK